MSNIHCVTCNIYETYPNLKNITLDKQESCITWNLYPENCPLLGDKLFIGKPLFTKDGRKVGNGKITRINFSNDPSSVSYNVETDFGNRMELNETEINKLYYIKKAL